MELEEILRSRTALIMLVVAGLTTFGAGAAGAAVPAGRADVSNINVVLNETGKRPENATCRAVREIVIIGGEEAKITRTLCRVNGASAFAPLSRQ